jgi:PAS domain S-box-containing protein
MQLFASHLCFFLPTSRCAPDIFTRMVSPIYALPVLLFSAPMGLTVHRTEDAFIGLSCIAIAGTLASFLMTTGRGIPLRWMLIALTVCTTVAGLFSLLSAALANDHPVLAGQAPLFGAVLAILTALLLPLLLPLLLSKARELRVTSLAARQSETRFLAATQSSSDAFMLLDTLRSLDGKIEDFLFRYLNTNAEKILQLPASRVLGARLTRVLPINPTDRLFQQFCQVIFTGKPLIHEFPLDAKDPASPWVRHHVARLGEDGEVGLAITASDITARKHADRNPPRPSLSRMCSTIP